jgi:hypothetical protein
MGSHSEASGWEPGKKQQENMALGGMGPIYSSTHLPIYLFTLC